MNESDPALAGEGVTALILEIFRLNGRLLAAGDRLVAGLGLSSARWQVLGAIALADTPQPVAHLARSMGLNRQGVQRIVNEMVDEDILAFRDNPHHRRARLVVMTSRGKTAYEAAGRRQKPWVDALAQGLATEDVAACLRLIGTLRQRLEADAGPE
ncbi:MarR family transcriptional regulator [Labrys sp. LIt4]|uniref:MarR family transcriptional regulator n=1 Tax=Labrys okinawensis TaxID=346911 RepID=A0A2S9Q9S2_9HYPH|nr:MULTISPECIES: MarR family transcriptional regulator [Labrys]MBP0581619.1 MarR family transcriptional regulator [Labrys sp. LIt4]PRH86093.1 MarR family transcriptional regulator [Labrys okinawensis]